VCATDVHSHPKMLGLGGHLCARWLILAPCDQLRAWQVGAWPLYATQNAVDVRRRTWPLSRDSAVEEAGGEVRIRPPCFSCTKKWVCVVRHWLPLLTAAEYCRCRMP